MISECENPVGSKTRIGSPAFVPKRPSGASSAILRRASSPCAASEKNDLWHLWAVAPRFLRPQGSSGPRLVLWRHARVPGGRGPARALWPLWHRETGKAALVGRQSLLHQALRLLRGPTLSQLGHSRCSSGVAPRLE